MNHIIHMMKIIVDMENLLTFFWDILGIVLCPCFYLFIFLQISYLNYWVVLFTVLHVA